MFDSFWFDLFDFVHIFAQSEDAHLQKGPQGFTLRLLMGIFIRLVELEEISVYSYDNDSNSNHNGNGNSNSRNRFENPYETMRRIKHKNNFVLKVSDINDIHSQIAHLISLSLLSKIGKNESNLDEIKLKCNIDLDYATFIAQLINVDLKVYLESRV